MPLIETNNGLPKSGKGHNRVDGEGDLAAQFRRSSTRGDTATANFSTGSNNPFEKMVHPLRTVGTAVGAGNCGRNRVKAFLRITAEHRNNS